MPYTLETRLEKESRALVALIRIAFGMAENLPSDLENVSWNYVYKLANFHDVANIVFYALDKVNLPEEIKAKFVRKREIARYKTASQIECTEILKKTLCENKVTFCLLKGAVIRSLYPREDMRTSGDVDILYNMDDADEQKIEAIMNNLGFEKVKGSKTVDSFSDGKFVMFEMHRRLCYDEDAELLPKAFDNLLETSQSAGNSEFEKKMSLEDYYIFHISHMAKHFTSHGCGIRPLIDLYLFNKHFSEAYDRKKIDDGLCETGLLEFERRCLALSQNMLEGTKPDETGHLMLNVMMFSGVYGNMQRSAVNEKQSENLSRPKGTKKLVKTAFLPLANMKVKYPILKKAPILLPAMWCVRICDVVLHKSGKIKTAIENYNTVDENIVRETRELMDKLNLK